MDIFTFKTVKFHLSFVIALLIFSQWAYTQSDRQNFFKKWVDKNGTEISFKDSSLKSSTLRAFKNMVGNARIFALGEPLHNLSEPLEIRNELFKYMITEMGFTAIALETSFSKAKK